MATQPHPGASAVDDPSPALEPAAYTSHAVEAGGLKLNYFDYGTPGRTPLLCVHGGGANAHWFDFVAAGLVADYHVRALDLRGHGDSELVDPPDYSYARYAADMAEAVERLDLRDFILVGHSMGGMCSLVYSATFPGRVAKLVIIDSMFNMGADRIETFHRVGSREGGSYASQAEFVTRFRLRPDGTLAAANILRHVAQESGRRSPDGRWRAKFDRKVYATRKSMNGFPYWDKIKIPALLIKGDHSNRINAEVFSAVQARCPQTELAEVPRSDHHVTLDNPRGFVQMLSAWLSKAR
jgi:pimeloyl-ACP methyl ester carboxylesterase